LSSECVCWLIPEPWPSAAWGVAQLANCDALLSVWLTVDPFGREPGDSESSRNGVGQAQSSTTLRLLSLFPASL
jgi:hypothetical protein